MSWNGFNPRGLVAVNVSDIPHDLYRKGAKEDI
jgi:hypothetical protein